MMICWLNRLWGVLGARELGDEPELVRRHRLRCRACRARAALERRLAGDLSAEAHLTRRPAPPFLAGRIVRALGHAAPLSRGPAYPVVRFARVALPLGVALVAWHLATREGVPPPPDGPRGALRNTARDAEAESRTPLAIAAAFPAAGRLLELGQALDQPLQAELDAVVQDARTAMQFLACNFLPEQQP